jgi:hypothetical protein
MMYREIDFMYENTNELRNIINIITGVADMVDERENDRERNRNNGENTRQQRRRFNNHDYNFSNFHDIFHTRANHLNSINRTSGLNRQNLFTRLESNTQTSNNTNNTNNTNGLNRTPRHTNTNLNRFLLNFYDNVPVYPSREQINNGTREVLFSSIQNPLNISCPITLETFDGNDTITQILGCGHLFNSINLSSWFRNNVRCPVCRYDIRNYIPGRRPIIEVAPTNRNSRPNSPVRVQQTIERNTYLYQEEDDDQNNDSQNDNVNDDESKNDESNDESGNEDTRVNNSPETQSSGSTLHTATSENNQEPDHQEADDQEADDQELEEEREIINNLTSITQNLISSLLNNGQTEQRYNEIVYNLPYLDPSSNEIIFEGYIQNNFRF